MAGNCDNVDIELFIGEVKKYPQIWNAAEESYHDRLKKRQAWISICRVFSEGFDEQDDQEKNAICNKLIKKWRNIKDNFLKSSKKKTKSRQAANSGKRYIYARQLSFLQTAGATTEAQSNLRCDNEEDDLEQTEELRGHNLMQSMEFEQPPFYDNNPPKKHKRDIESSFIYFMKSPILSSIVPAIPEPNADRSFFESILPSISNFTEDQKIEFRCEILNLIKQMRMTAHK